MHGGPGFGVKVEGGLEVVCSGLGNGSLCACVVILLFLGHVRRHCQAPSPNSSNHREDSIDSAHPKARKNRKLLWMPLPIRFSNKTTNKTCNFRVSSQESWGSHDMREFILSDVLLSTCGFPS